MRKLFIALLLMFCSSAFAQWSYDNKPMMGTPIDISHPPSDFKLFLPMWEGSGGQVFDLSRNGNDGTLTGTFWTSGNFGHALGFDGVDDIVNVGRNLILDWGTTLTVTAWINVSSSHANYDMIYGRELGANDRNGLWISNTNKIHFREHKDATGINSNTSIPLDRWCFVAAVLNGSSRQVYLNGVLDNSDAAGMTPNIVVDDFFIGRNIGETNRDEFLGKISSVSFYNRALTAGEIALLYREPFCMFDSEDVALITPAPTAPGGGQVIMITSLPWVLSIILLYSIAYLRTKREKAA